MAYPRKYSPEVHEFVKEHAKKLRDRDLVTACNEKFGTEFTVSKMKNFRNNYGYLNGKKQWTSEEYWKYQTRYPKGMYEFIKENSWGVSSEEMAKIVNEKFGTSWTRNGMKQFRQRHGIKSGVTGWFRKGRAPATKGMKQEDYIKDPAALERARATRFRKGNSPANELPIGTVVENHHGYLLRKRQMEGGLWDRWEFYHRYVWKQHNGPIPEGMYVSFKDCNPRNCDIDNLMLITKAENVTLTKKGYRSEDPDLTMAGLNVIRLTNAIKEKKKQK